MLNLLDWIRGDEYYQIRIVVMVALTIMVKLLFFFAFFQVIKKEVFIVVLTSRDYLILHLIHRFRFCLGRHIKDLCGFSGSRIADRRLKILCDNGYLQKQKVLYGTPTIYTLTHKAKVLIGVSRKKENIRVERLLHNIAVLDCVVYLVQKKQLTLEEIKTEREMFSADGFGAIKHRPDFIHVEDGTTNAYEVELTLKSIDRFHANIKENYLNYHNQIWIVPQREKKIHQLLSDWQDSYSNLEIIFLEELITNKQN